MKEILAKVRGMVNQHSSTINELVNVVNDMHKRIVRIEGVRRKPDVVDVEYKVINKGKKGVNIQKNNYFRSGFNI